MEQLRQGLRVRAAAYWLHVPWVCAYQTMHGDLSPAGRLLAASYSFCTVLWMVSLREFVDPQFRPLERESQASGKMRWGVSNESCRKLLVTLSTVIRHLGVVTAPIRANAFGTLSAERFFSCIRRVLQK
jgi:hypothetical protein